MVSRRAPGKAGPSWALGLRAGGRAGFHGLHLRMACLSSGSSGPYGAQGRSRRDEIDVRLGGGIEIPGGLSSPELTTKRIVADSGASATVPAIFARGRADHAPGGHFVGNAPLRVSAETGGNPAIYVEALEGAMAPAILASVSPQNPRRAVISLTPHRQPSTAIDGDFYLDSQTHRLRVRIANEWVDVSLPNSETRHRIAILAPSGNWNADVPVTYHSDGRRVWIDGRISRLFSGSDLIFTLPVGFRPSEERYLMAYNFYPGGAALITVTPSGQVRATGMTSTVSALALSGLSFPI